MENTEKETEYLCTVNTVTEEAVNDSIASEEYLTVGKKTTLCLITLKNGFEVVGTSACVDPAKYDIEVGKPFARKKAIDIVWTVLGATLQNTIYNDKKVTDIYNTCPK